MSRIFPPPATLCRCCRFPQISPLHFHAADSFLAVSTPAFWCRCFLSRCFMSRVFSVPASMHIKSAISTKFPGVQANHGRPVSSPFDHTIDFIQQPIQHTASYAEIPVAVIESEILVAPLCVTRMWANAQRDGRPAEYRWRPLFNAAKFG